MIFQQLLFAFVVISWLTYVYVRLSISLSIYLYIIDPVILVFLEHKESSSENHNHSTELNIRDYEENKWIKKTGRWIEKLQTVITEAIMNYPQRQLVGWGTKGLVQ